MAYRLFLFEKLRAFWLVFFSFVLLDLWSISYFFHKSGLISFSCLGFAFYFIILSGFHSVYRQEAEQSLQRTRAVAPQQPSPLNLGFGDFAQVKGVSKINYGRK